MAGTYQEMDILSATPEMLVVKLYDGALRFATAAREQGAAGDVVARGNSLARALAIVAELRGALDFEAGGQIAHNLGGLYAFVSERLMQAHVSGAAADIDSALEVMRTLRSAWAEIASNPPTAAVAVAEDAA